MLSKEISTLMGSDPRLVKMQILLLFGMLLLVGVWGWWNEWGEIAGYFIVNLPTAITLIHLSNKVLFDNGRPNSHYVAARIGTIVGILLFIPKWLFYVWFGWQIGLFG